MPVLDRTILRLATWELIAEPDVPVAVVIDEAVELAKQYSTEQSGGFVNGVLSHHRPPGARPSLSRRRQAAWPVRPASGPAVLSVVRTVKRVPRGPDGTWRSPSGRKRTQADPTARWGLCSSGPGSRRRGRPAGLTRIAHEIVERNHGLEDVVVVGLQTGGVPLALPLAQRARGDGGHGRPGGHARRGLLPRRHRHPPGAARGHHRHPLRPGRPAGRPGRRRALHRPDGPGRAQRPGRLRPGPGRAAGGDGRPGPSRAARSAPTTWARTCPPASTNRST